MHMFESFFALFFFATAAFAQSALIGLPTFEQTVSAGSNLTVQVQRPVCPTALHIFFASRLINHAFNFVLLPRTR